jgi:uncharacterized protein (DUF433 family)
MDVSQYLERDPDTLAGAVRIKGTRLSVDFVLELLEKGWTEKELSENYEQLTPAVLADIFAFARQSLRAEQIISIAS